MKRTFDIASLIRPSVKVLKPYSSARDEYVSDGSEMVFLDANENPYPNGVNRYPDPYQRGLKEVLSLVKGVPPQNMLLGNGSDEVLDLLFRAFCEPNVDNVITLPPTYGMYKVLAGVNAVENREVLLTEEFQPNVKGILKMADAKSKLLFLCSPNNPTGNAFGTTLIRQLLDEFKGLVVIDEAYIDFAETESWVNVLNDYPNLVVTQTLSKAYGMAGIRLGICYGSEETITVLNRIKPPYNVNELTQQRALERLQKKEAIREEISEILRQKHILMETLETLPFVNKVYNSEANFILARVDDANKRYQQLLDQKVVVRNRSNQPLCENTLRFTVGTQAENAMLISLLKKMD
ncbi:MAG: histidinol-phosphate transaminase [Bacteroidota bacterium]